MRPQPDIHDRLVIAEAERIARELVLDELIKIGVDYADEKHIEMADMEMLADQPSLFQAAYDKLRRN